MMELSSLTGPVLFCVSSGASRTAELRESNRKDKGTDRAENGPPRPSAAEPSVGFKLGSCDSKGLPNQTRVLAGYKSESGLMKMKHLRSLTSGSVLTPANAGCYNYPAGVSESPPTADAICLLTSARATAEPDFPRLCE
ncbi:unnamed protein product [Tetraodon nigroviridis]|uniref:(spotted green pufferfish) hypothetical protein n=1 Tax=Tetraodon nigroviridis TaxID=99883 RepID=Q4S793_TETNG|nr:unnamed protein product [Tetraodon nigroviridis]